MSLCWVWIDWIFILWFGWFTGTASGTVVAVSFFYYIQPALSCRWVLDLKTRYGFINRYRLLPRWSFLPRSLFGSFQSRFVVVLGYIWQILFLCRGIFVLLELWWKASVKFEVGFWSVI
jgi:hypothetical protein